ERDEHAAAYVAANDVADLVEELRARSAIPLRNVRVERVPAVRPVEQEGVDEERNDEEAEEGRSEVEQSEEPRLQPPADPLGDTGRVVFDVVDRRLNAADRAIAQLL